MTTPVAEVGGITIEDVVADVAGRYFKTNEELKMKFKGDRDA